MKKFLMGGGKREVFSMPMKTGTQTERGTSLVWPYLVNAYDEKTDGGRGKGGETGV